MSLVVSQKCNALSSCSKLLRKWYNCALVNIFIKNGLSRPMLLLLLSVGITMSFVKVRVCAFPSYAPEGISPDCSPVEGRASIRQVPYTSLNLLLSTKYILLLFWSEAFCVTSPCNAGTELILACNFCVLFSSEWWLLEYILNNEHLFLTKFSQEPLLMLVVGWQLFNWALEPAEDEILDELFLLGYQDALVWVNQQQTILSPHSNGAATQTGRPPPPLENLSQTSSI